MRPYHFNCLEEGKGKNLTPNIDRLAIEGTVLMGQHVVSPVCTPSRYNCLTGRYASRATNQFFIDTTAKNENQTVVGFNTHITPEDATLQKYLQEAGYVTGMTGKNHVVQVEGIQTFKSYEENAKDPEVVEILRSNHELVKNAVARSGFDFVGNVYHNNPDFLGIHEIAVQNMDWITEGGLNFLKTTKEKPFFLYFATTVPHEPFTEARSWNADPRITAIGYLDEAPKVQPARHTIAERLIKAGLPVNEDTANMLWLDDALGALMDQLEKTGELDNTIIFFFSDHGQNAKGTLYKGGVYDPSIVWRKGGFPVGNVLADKVSNVDFAPTILDMAGQSWKDKAFDGVSFLSALNGLSTLKDRVLYHELGYARAIQIGDYKYLAVRYPSKYENMTLEERKEKLEKWNADRERRHIPIVTRDFTKPFSHLTPLPGGGHAENESTGAYPHYYDRDQLYNITKDPNEQINLANDPEYQAQYMKMKTELAKIIQSLPGDFNL